jgi:hypothetical protein
MELTDGTIRNCLRAGSSDFGEAGLVGLEDVAAETVGDELAFAGGFDQAGGLEFLHMVGDGGGGDVAATAEGLAGEAIAGAANAAQEIEAAWVGQSPGDEVDAVFGEGGRGHNLC